MRAFSDTPRTTAEPEISEEALIAGLRRADERIFLALVTKYHAAMLRIATAFVLDSAVGEEIVQEAWLGVIKGIDRFEGRSSLKTWIFSILANCAKTRRSRESRTIPFSDLNPFEEYDDEPLVDPERFTPADHPQWPNAWADPPSRWAYDPEDQVLTAEVMGCIQRAIAALPASQQAIITLRDIDGWPAEEVCNVLGLTETNQRVILHRARAKVRRALEMYFAEETQL